MVRLHTNFGIIALDLDAERAPETVKNFLAYVESAFYSNTVFHRVIDGFMVQGGGFEPGMRQKPARTPIKNEADNGLKNERYTIAMARTSEPHSASSQFFINVKDNGFLAVDEKLARGRMRFGSPGHGDRVALVLEAVIGFVLDEAPDRFLSHSRLESAALDHETVDDAVKHGVGIEARFDILEKILDRFGCASGIELERDDAEVGLKLDHGAPLFGWFQRDRFDRDGPLRNVLVLLDRRGRRLGNSQHSVHPLDHASKHRVSESPRGRLAVIEK